MVLEQVMKPQAYATEVHVDWCPGCGDFGILRTIQMALAEMRMDPSQVAVVSGIGCSAKTIHYLRAYGIHTLHGRALPYAMGIKLANPNLKVVAVSGDGDGRGGDVGGPRLLVRRQASQGPHRRGDPPPRIRVPRRPPALPDVQRHQHQGVVRRGGPEGGGRPPASPSRVQARGG